MPECEHISHLYLSFPLLHQCAIVAHGFKSDFYVLWTYQCYEEFSLLAAATSSASNYALFILNIYFWLLKYSIWECLVASALAIHKIFMQLPAGCVCVCARVREWEKLCLAFGAQ